MKEKNKGMHIAVLVIGIIVYLIVFLCMGPLRQNPRFEFLSDYMGVLSAFLVLITTIIVTTNGKRGYIASIILCSLSIWSAASAVLRSHTPTGLPGVFTPIVNIIAMTVILTYINTNKRQTQELNEQYEQIMDKNRAMEEKDEALRVYAYKDLLTGMYNLRHFREQLEEAIRQQAKFSVIYIDLDNFKGINDTFGPKTGDAALVAYAERVSSYCGNKYPCARVAGDEFGILLMGEQTEADILNIIEQLRRLFGEQLGVQGANLSITASYGIVTHPRDGRSAETLLDSMIMAVYNAKANGKDRPCFFSQA